MTVNPIVTPVPSLDDDHAAVAASFLRNGYEPDNEWFSKLLQGQHLSALDMERLKDNRQSIPLLDRRLAESSQMAASSSSSSDQPVLVRIRGGFVQDMFPSEYFETTTSNSGALCRSPVGRSPAATPELAERTPLLITPIPFSTPWFRNVLSEKQVEHRNKRARGHLDMTNMMNTDTDGKQHTSHGDGNNDEHDDEEEESSSGRWWDAETMKSDPDQVPVLAHFYYDQYRWASQHNPQQPSSSSSPTTDSNTTTEDHKLRLNDIVEIIGILENSHDDDNGDNNDDDMDMAVDTNHGNAFGSIMDVDEGAFWDEDDAAMTTPPKHIPRLHVLWFGGLDFDTIAAQTLCQNSITLAPHEKPNNDDNNNNDNGNVDMASSLLASALEIDQLSATALYLNLLSMAERQPSYGHEAAHGKPTRKNIVTQTPSGATLGCCSLQLILPNHDMCCRFQQALENVLSQIVPSITSIHMGGDGKSRRLSKKSLQLPARNQGRIQPTLWQLPQGSTLIINTSSHNQNAATMDPSMSQALEMLTMNHHLPYQFDGGVKIPFEADVRVIVLSAAATDPSSSNRRPHIVPCTIQAKCCFQSSSSNQEHANVDDDPNSNAIRRHCLSEEQATFLRQCLSRARGGSSNNNNIGLPSAVLERARDDFIKRRTAFREREQQQQQQQGSSGTMETTSQNTTSIISTTGSRHHLPDDMDLHRWLTWTRLLARQGRGSTMAVCAGIDNVAATVQDWERALALDDALMNSVMS